MPVRSRANFGMPFAWSESGKAPAGDEIEVSIFGPGFGECIVVHVGGGEWIIVDSCIDSSARQDPRPVAEQYLRSLGVAMESRVKLIVATHWHDDHVGGMARLVDVCRGARFSCANSLLQREFIDFIESMGKGSAATDGAKVKEFRQIIRIFAADRARPAIRFASGSRDLISWHQGVLPHQQAVKVRSLSPSDQEFTLFLQRIGDELPQYAEAKRAAARSSPNLASVVLHLELGQSSVLLGADMEIHHDVRRGWSAVLEDAATSNTSPASLFKVAHHGSINGHHDQVWSQMLVPDPVCVVTPFNKLPIGKKLPKTSDVVRIRSLGKLFISGEVDGKARSKGRDAAVERSLRENGIALRDLRTPVGVVRMRRSVNSPGQWQTELFPPASEVFV